MLRPIQSYIIYDLIQDISGELGGLSLSTPNIIEGRT